MKNEPLTGRKFGRWTVLNDYIKVNKGERKWLCRCDCGTERYVLERGLLHGSSTSCGCGGKQRAVEDLTGRVYGELTVLEPVARTYPDRKRRWLCRCSCGREEEVAGTLLRAGRVSACRDCRRKGGTDIAGKTFHRLTALRPTGLRQNGSVVWRCRCQCGREVDVSYNRLLYSDVRSCGCGKRQQEQQLNSYLTHVAGTSLDMIRSRKLPENNTTGYKGVYLVGGRYKAKIVFQKKQFYLGVYDHPEQAAAARREAEALLFDGTAEYYARWQKRADADRDWAIANPVQIRVRRNSAGELQVEYSPVL